ncbi:MAG: cell envelope integrity protein CreD [Helicobacteraceae bacterium]|nr:cell envelope integrity protein CreD [Helicobacteraceae bacterium]
MFKRLVDGYTFRVIMLVFLALILLIPLGLIVDIVEERENTANHARSDIMSLWGGELIAAGPFVALEGAKLKETIITNNGEERRRVEYVDPFKLIIAPKELQITGEFKTETRRRGIFSVPLFYGELSFKGSFDPAAALASIAIAPQEKINDGATLAFLLGDLKGIRKVISAKLGDKELFFQPAGTSVLARGGKEIVAIIDDLPKGETSFEIVLEIQGGERARFAPIGQNTRAEIASDWNSPSFQGDFLPARSTIESDRFSASWEINYLSRDIPLAWRQSGESDMSLYDELPLFGVDFFRAIDAYALNTRAVKYAILILIVPFLTLFLLEIVAKTRVHPVPYMLCGVGNAVFYLLLLSLSEQIPFYAAYVVAAFAVTAMLTLYARALLPSKRASLFMGLVAAVAYLILYALLNAESYALLIGSFVTFGVIALIMFLTRNFDWYRQNET